jgi:tetratricopeptide (TPR) repeat protein
MKRLSVLVLLTLVGLIAVAQSGKEFEKNANDAYQAKNYPKAFLDYSRAVEAYEKEGKADTALYYNTTIAGYKAKKYEELVPFAQKAIDLKYEKAHLAYYLMAVAYDKLGKDEEYMEALEKGHKAFPNYKKISQKLAIAYLKEGMKPYKEGAQIITDAEPIRESDTEKYLAEIEKANAKFKESLEVFLQAFEANPKEEQVLKVLLSVYQNLEMQDKAAEIESKLN